MEDGFWFLLGLAALTLPVGALLGLIAFFKIGDLKRRVARLENDLAFALSRLRPIDDAFVAQGIVPPVGAPATPQAPAEAVPPPVAEPVAVAARVPTITPPTQGTAEPAPTRDLESTLGTRWAVWVGGLALALGGIFLVRTSIEQGWLGPELRLVLAALLGAALVGVGDVLRRRGWTAPLGGLAYADVPSILVAAGTSTLFATTYAAHGLYGFIGPAAAFAALVAVALGTVLLSLLHAPWLAGLGLIGGYVAPLLVSSQAPSAWPAVALTAVLTGTAFVLVRFRGWYLLGLLALAGHTAWGALLVLDTADIPAGGTIVLLTVGLGIALGASRTRFATVDNMPSPGDIRLGLVTAGLGALFALMLVGAYNTQTLPLVVAGVTVAALAVGGVVLPSMRWTTVIGAVLAVLTIAAFDAIKPVLADGARVDPRTLGIIADQAVDRVVWTSVAFAALFGLGGLIASVRTGDARVAAAGALTPVAILAVCYLRFRLLGAEMMFGFAALALAVAMAAAAEWFVRRDPDGFSALWGAAGLYGAGGAAALGIALGLLTPSGGLPLGFALASLGIGWVHGLRGLPLLRWAALGAGLIAAGLIGRDPDVFWPGPETWPLVNSLLTSLALPALATAGAAVLLRRGGRDDVPVIGLEGLASALALAWAWLALGDLIGRFGDDGPSTAAQLGPRAVLLAGAAITFERLATRLDSLVYRFASHAAFGLAAVAAIGALVTHPWLEPGTIAGNRVLNDLLLAYLLPGVIGIVLTLRARRHAPNHVVTAGIEALTNALLVAYALAEISVLFRGPALAGPVSSAEFWTYSVAGLAYGILLLGLGLATGRRVLRLASAAVLVVTVAKVFLLDMAGLTGLWRALSFIGLGAVLLAIGLVYQRLLARRPAAPTGEPA